MSTATTADDAVVFSAANTNHVLPQSLDVIRDLVGHDIGTGPVRAAHVGSSTDGRAGTGPGTDS